MTALANLAARLQQRPFELTPEQIADALWLAKLYTAQTRQPLPPSTVEAKPESEPEQHNHAPPGVTAMPATQPHEGADITLPTERQSATASGFPIRVPSAPALPDALAIGRALRPLRRRVAGTRRQLDEAATTRFIGDTDIWIAITRPVRERWLEVDVVVDDGRSMRVWSKTVAEFLAVLEFNGAFRTVRTWRLDTEGEPRLTTGAADRRNPMELIDPHRRRLVVVLTDCVSPAWHEGGVARLLAHCAQSGPVVVAQMLPQRLWPRTALRRGIKLSLSAARPGLSNDKLVRASTRKSTDRMICLPIVTLDPSDLRSWTRVVAGLSASTIGYALPSAPPIAMGSRRPAPLEDRVDRFRATSTEPARRLASYLATVPISMPVVRLVRTTMVPEARDSDLAELFLSGLLEEIAPSDDPDLIQYEFVEGARDRLLDSLDSSKAREVLLRVSEYVEGRIGQAREFPAVLARRGSAISSFALRHRAFATIASRVLAGYGGEYATIATELAEASNQAAPVVDSIATVERATLGSHAFAGLVFENQNAVSVAYLVRPNLAVTAGAFAFEEIYVVRIASDSVDRRGEVILVEGSGEMVFLFLDPPVGDAEPIPSMASALIMAAPATVLGGHGETATGTFTSANTITYESGVIDPPCNGAPILQGELVLGHVVSARDRVATFHPAFLVNAQLFHARRLAEASQLLRDGGGVDEVRFSIERLNLDASDVRRLWSSRDSWRRWAALVAIRAKKITECRDILEQAIESGGVDVYEEATAALDEMSRAMQIADLASQYLALRDQAADLTRTAAMERFVNTIPRQLAATTDAAEVDALFRGGDGHRIIALALLLPHMTPPHIDVIAEAIERPHSAFEQWLGIRVAGEIVDEIGPAQVERLRIALKLRRPTTPDSDRDNLASSLLERLAQYTKPTPSLHSLLAGALDRIRTVTGTGYDQITLLANSGELTVVAAATPSESYRIESKRGIVGAALEGSVVDVPDVEADVRYIESYRLTRSELAVPIIRAGMVIGVINSESTQRGHFLPTHVTALQAIATELAEQITLPFPDPLPPIIQILVDPTETNDPIADASKPHAAVVGSDIVAFAAGITAQSRDDIKQAILLAQLVAKQRVPEPADLDAWALWHRAYFDSLASLGFAVQDSGFATYKTKGGTFEAQREIIEIATALYGSGSTAVETITKTLEAFHRETSHGSSQWLTLFDRESTSANTARFQVSLASPEADGSMSVSMIAFGLQATRKTTQVLFFKFRSGDVALRNYSGKASIDVALLAELRDYIHKKVSVFAPDLVRELPGLE